MDATRKVLVLCTGNSCRSQMADGYLRRLLPDNWEVYSAGVATHGINPYAARAMSEDSIDITGHTSNHIDEYRDIDFSLVLTVCDHARETCPWFPSDAVMVHHSFVDPADATGSDEEKIAVYRATRDEIRAWLPGFVERYVKGRAADRDSLSI